MNNLSHTEEKLIKAQIYSVSKIQPYMPQLNMHKEHCRSYNKVQNTYIQEIGKEMQPLCSFMQLKPPRLKTKSNCLSVQRLTGLLLKTGII